MPPSEFLPVVPAEPGAGSGCTDTPAPSGDSCALARQEACLAGADAQAAAGPPVSPISANPKFGRYLALLTNSRADSPASAREASHECSPSSSTVDAQIAGALAGSAEPALAVDSPYQLRPVTEAPRHLQPATAAEDLHQLAEAQRRSEESLEAYRCRSAAAERRLAPTLTQYGIVRECTRHDGDCQFASLAWHVYQDQSRHVEIRRVVMTIFDIACDQYSSFLDPAEAPSDYYVRMSRPGEWGDEATLQIFLDLVGLPAVLFTDNLKRPHYEVHPQQRLFTGSLENMQREAPQCREVFVLRDRARAPGRQFSADIHSGLAL